MRNVIILGFFFVWVTTIAVAEPHKGLVAIETSIYAGSLEFKEAVSGVDGITVDIEGSSSTYWGEYFLDENTSILATIGTDDREYSYNVPTSSANVSATVKSESESELRGFGVKFYALPRPNLITGEGQGVSFGIFFGSSKSTTDNETSKSDYTNLGLEYTQGLGDGLSFYAGLTFDSEDMIDAYRLSGGVTKTIENEGDYFFVSAGYIIEFYDDDEGEGSVGQLSISAGYYF